MVRSLLLLALLALYTNPARAECANPPAEMGVVIFNKAHKVMQYCNGDDWVGLRGGGGGDGASTPSGAVMAFDLSACPDGWSEYTPARGRFIRGIDNGAGNDPDGLRIAGHVQADALGSHTHTGTTNSAGAHTHGYVGAQWHDRTQYGGETERGGTNLNRTTDSAGAHTHTLNIDPAGAAETRPKNVALLYCRKD